MEKYILMIDDDLDDFQILNEMLANYPGLRCHYACNAAIGIEMMMKYRPGVVLLDLNMPVTGGLECLKMIKGIPEIDHIPVVIFSTNVSDGLDNTQLYRASCCIKKPFSYKDYRTVIDKLITLMDYSPGPKDLKS